MVDLAPFAVTQAVKHGGEQEYNIALAIYNSPPTPQHQIAAIMGLTATRLPGLIQKTAGMLLGGQVQEQHLVTFLSVSHSPLMQLVILWLISVIQGMAQNPLSRRMVWQFVQAGWTGLEAKLQGTFALGKLVQFSFES